MIKILNNIEKILGTYFSQNGETFSFLMVQIDNLMFLGETLSKVNKLMGDKSPFSGSYYRYVMA